MGSTWTIEVGHSTRAMAGDDLEAGVRGAAAAGGNIVELSAFDAAALDAVAAALQSGRRIFRRISVHAPVAFGSLSEAELVGKLASLQVPVVVHPEMIVTPATWLPLGKRLLIENNDGRKANGSSPVELSVLFAALPEARFCLDVSHATDVGGPELAATFAAAFRGRLAEVHAGCGCGARPGESLGVEVLRALTGVVATAGRSLPVIIERRPSGSAGALAQVYAVRGAVVAGVQSRLAA